MKDNNSPLPFRHIHFIGIAGAGMSSIAAYLCQAGYKVTGSDASPNKNILDYLQKCGAKVSLTHDIQDVANADAVVYSAAIPENNPERQFAQNARKLLQRGEILARISNAHHKSWAICGTHGKGTTAGALVHICQKAGWKTSYILGARMQGEPFASHFEKNADILICEVDESDKTHMFHQPRGLLINNLEADHLNVYGSLNAIADSFVQLVKNCISFGSDVFIQKDGVGYPILAEFLADVPVHWLAWNACPAKGYGAAQFTEKEDGTTSFQLTRDGKNIALIEPNLKGENNAHDLFSAASIADSLNISPEIITQAAKSYAGLVDRCHAEQNDKGMTLVTDYASHPTCIRRDIAWLRKNAQRVIAIYQPFRYTLMTPLWSELIQSLRTADIALIAPFDGAGETPIPNISSESLASAIQNLGTQAISFNSFDEIAEYASKILTEGDCLVVFGGGYIFQMAREIMGLA